VKISGHSTESARHALLVAALLRIGSDTRGARAFKDLLWPAVTAWADLEATPHRLARAFGWSPDASRRAIQEADADAVRARERAAAAGCELVTIADERYPERLTELADPPIAFWTRGVTGVLSLPAVAIVGSRNASPVGAETARRLAHGLASAGLVVVSGLARGIDAAAHRGTLEAGGVTVGVLGCGVDVPYPREHGELASSLRARGCLLSELPPGTPPLPRHFPLRNRIISGLSAAVVVVEASEKSGSLITARMALEQGRDVLAVPGNVVSGCHRGCHALIKDGARLVETVEDILDEIGWVVEPAGQSRSSNQLRHNELLAAIPVGEAFCLEDLAGQTGRPVPDIFAELAQLELDGVVVRSGVGRFVRRS
jgi:DNA processing protein